MNLYYILFNQVLLCDSIEDLKDDLQEDLTSLKYACHDYEVLSKLHHMQKLKVLHSNNSLTSSDINWDLLQGALDSKTEGNAIIRSIRRNAVIIRRSQSGFKPPLELILSRYQRILDKNICGFY